jgi:hypothetical protein
VTTSDTHPVPMLTRHLLSSGRNVVIWFWAVLVLVWAGFFTALAVFTDVRISTWQWGSLTPPKAFLLVIGIIAAGVELPMFIAQGITRRHYGLACLAATGITVVAFAAFWLAWYGVEYLTLSATGLASELDSPYPVGSVADALAVFVRAVVALLAWTGTGWLAGLGFYRFSPLWGLPFVPLAALPLVVVEWSFNTDRLGFALDATIGLAAVAAAILGIYFLLRDVPIRKISG